MQGVSCDAESTVNTPEQSCHIATTYFNNNQNRHPNTRSISPAVREMKKRRTTKNADALTESLCWCREAQWTSSRSARLDWYCCNLCTPETQLTRTIHERKADP